MGGGLFLLETQTTALDQIFRFWEPSPSGVPNATIKGCTTTGIGLPSSAGSFSSSLTARAARISPEPTENGCSEKDLNP